MFSTGNRPACMQGNSHASLAAERAAVDAREPEHQQGPRIPPEQLLADLRGGCPFGLTVAAVYWTQTGWSTLLDECQSLACVTQYASCWWYMPTHLGLCSGISARCRKLCTAMRCVSFAGQLCNLRCMHDRSSNDTRCTRLHGKSTVLQAAGPEVWLQ